MLFVSRIKYLFAVTIILALLFAPKSVEAQGVNDFRFIDFTADYKLSNEDLQGTLEITETMQLDFSGQNRGILRAIPNTYKGIDLNIEILDIQRDGQPESYITYQENENTVLQIGEPTVFITGEHAYVVSYQLENVITFYDDHDELFWDVNGDEWLQPFDAVSTRLVHDAAIKTDLPAQCFTGVRGSEETNCNVVEDVNRSDFVTTTELQPGETLSIVQAFEKGHFSPPSWIEQHWRQLIVAPLALLQLGFTRSAYNKWKKYGKDRDRRSVAPFFGRPKNVSVMMAHYVANNRLDQKAITASIIDLAVRRYLQIVERKVGRSIKHDLVLINNDHSDLSAEETMLLDALFTSKTADETVELEAKKAKLHGTFQSITKHLDKAAKADGYYDISPKNPGKHLGKEIGFSVLILVVSLIGSGITNGLSMMTGIVGFGLVAVFGLLMARRSQKGVELAEHMAGLKLYLDMAEKDRIKQQDAVEAPLSPHSGQPKRTVNFFEKLLPFAIALGVEKSWAQAFADIYTQAPDWYRGTWNNGFTSAALVSSLSGTSKAVSQSFSAPSNSSGSGFSGGSAGGGGGGGGGGGW